MIIEHWYRTGEETLELPWRLDQLDIEYDIIDSTTEEWGRFYMLEFRLREDHPRFEEWQEAVSFLPLLPPLVVTQFHKSEFAAAEWFTMTTTTCMYSTPYYDYSYLETSFNQEDCCPTCKIGKVQTGPFRLRRKPLRNSRQIMGIKEEPNVFLVKEETMHVLERAEVTGISFSKLVPGREHWRSENVYQLHAGTTLKGGLDRFNVRRITCGQGTDLVAAVDEDGELSPGALYCGRTKYFSPNRGGLTYSPRVFKDMPDVVMTAEYFGNVDRAYQLMICSRRVKELFERHHLRGVDFDPIFHERFE